LQYKLAELTAVILLAILITVITAFSSINANYYYYYNVQSAFAAPLFSLSASPSNNIVNTKSIYEITFTTATTSTIKSVEIIFPRGSTMSGTQLIERVGIGPGIISTGSGPNGPVLTYTISSPVSIAAGIPIRFELANIVNTNTAGNAAISITTKDTNGAVIDGPTNSVAYPIRQIASGDIADNAITTNKIANGAVTSAKMSQDNIYTAWDAGRLGRDITLKVHAKMAYDPDTRGITGKTRGTAGQPAIAVSGNNVYVVWVNSTIVDIIGDDRFDDKKHNILFRKSSDGGGRFGSIINLGNNAAYFLGNATYAPAIAVSGNNVYVVWTAENKEILLRKSSDGGGTFGNIVKLGNNAGSSASPSLAVSGNNVYVAWQDIMQGNHEILLRKSSDGGGTFGRIINLSNNPGDYAFPSIAVSGNNVYVVWYVMWYDRYPVEGVLFRSSADGGGTFGITINLSSSTDYVFPAIAVS
jgi:hypothetical protein